MSSNHGLFVVPRGAYDTYRFRFRRGLTASDRYYHLLASDGLISEVFTGDAAPAGWRTTDGQLWLPTVKGVVVINPGKVKFKEPVLPVFIEKLVVDDQTILPNYASIFPKGTRAIEFHFTALNFSGFENIKFKCRLKSLFRDRYGIREKIVNQEQVHFQDMVPGKYSFSVSAGNEDKGWGEAAFYEFTIRYTLSGVEGFIFILIWR